MRILPILLCGLVAFLGAALIPAATLSPYWKDVMSGLWVGAWVIVLGAYVTDRDGRKRKEKGKRG